MTISKKHPLFQAAIAGLLLLIMLLVTDPYELPLIVLTLPFVLIGVFVYKTVFWLVSTWKISKGRRSYMAGVVTGLTLLTLLLQTIRQLSVKDFLILAALLVGLTFYMRKLDL